MNNNSVAPPPAPRDGESKKRDHEGKMINGDRHDAQGTPTVNGAPPTGSSSAPPVSAPSAPSPERFQDLPPEIASIAQDRYHPLSTLLMRISQETYNDLSETLTAMAEIPLVPQTNGLLPNGLGSHGGGQENVEANRRKKLLLMKFAQDNRAKFIKLLVLTEWGKKASKDVTQLIDLLGWAREQNEHMNFVETQLELIKTYSSAAAERNPDIRTALEILSTGKAPWMPTLGYIPPEPISSEQALKLFRYMNTSLSIRLNVHESLPRRLHDWRVHSGRATFIIENELEFDVVSFVEDSSEQWWFLDVRLLFSPAPVITLGSRFFNHLEIQANGVLRDKGLSGLFDFLCNFVLTHKITVLRSQASVLENTSWAGSLKVEKIHRELVVSYWTNKPGKKNWIEIGVSKNKVMGGKTSWRGPPLPSLTVRWFRQGVEMKGIDFGFDWHKLSFETVIKRVIAYHINDILRTTQQHLNPGLSAHTTLSESHPSDSKLQVTLGASGNTTQVSLEPLTGNYILAPANPISVKAENAFNQGREVQQMANIIAQLLAQTLQDNVQQSAQQLGWNGMMRSGLRLDTVKAAVKQDVLQYSLYSPRGWSPGWALAAIVDAAGVSWWIFEIASNSSAIDHADQIKMERPDGTALAINRNTLASLERVAVQLLSIRVTTRQLDKEKRSYRLDTEFGQATVASDTPRLTRAWALYLNTADLLTVAPGERPWLKSDLAIVCQGMRPEGGNIWHIATGRMAETAAEDMRKLMAASPHKGFKFSEDGRFRILLSTPFGQDVLADLRARLRDVNRLRSFARTLQKRQMRLVSSSLQRVEFQYGPTSHQAAVKFGAGKEIAVEMSHKNPHHRVHQFLADIANERVPLLPSVFLGDTSGLDRLCTTLVLTRPLATALNTLEASATNLDRRNPGIHAHSLFKYRITYDNPVCTFDVRVQYKDDKVYWMIEDNLKKHQHLPDLRPTPERSPTHRRLDTLQAKLKELFASTGERWFGTRFGIVAEIDGIGMALNKLDECVLSCKMEGGYIAPPPLEVPQKAQQQQPQVNGQQPVNQQQQQRIQQQQQHAARQQAQGQQQGQRRPQQQQQQQNPNQRAQMPNGRPGSRPQQQQQQQQQGRQQDVIEID